MARREHFDQLNMQIQPDLMAWFREYCQQRGLTMTAYITMHLLSLREREEEKAVRNNYLSED